MSTIHTIAGEALAHARREGDYIVTPLDMRAPWDDGGEVVTIHISNAPGLAHTLLDLAAEEDEK